MKKNLRFLCLSLVAATCAVGFAQENVTQKLLNADMSKGVLGWDITFENNIWKKQTKSQESYHGVNGACLENWKSAYDTGLSDNSISQTLKGLPNGTYVFGAYIVAAKNDSIARENREEIVGVNLFANEAFVPVATNWPERAAYKWSHPAKFNVAAQVTDGTLTVGLKAEGTNANFLLWDNATLYRFDEGVTPEEALDKMAQIDLNANVALADTCKAHVFNVDSVAQLDATIEAAKSVTAATAYEVDENLWWAFRQARKSINDYRGLNNTIKSAREVLAKEWSAEVADAVAELETLTANAEAMYTATTAVRSEINEMKSLLNEASACVELDECWLRLDTMDTWIDATDPGTDPGSYSDDMINRVSDLRGEFDVVLNSTDISAITVRHRCDSLYALVQDIWDNPISYDSFPILLGKGAEDVKGYKVLEGTTVNESDFATYTSKVYRFLEPLTKVRFIVKETGNNSKCGDFVFFTLSSFEMYDEDGNEIPLDADMLYSNADHNRLNPTFLDGDGIEGLLDGDPATFFHSTWSTVLEDHHYLEVTLPEGEYSAFSFSMTARTTGGNNYTHQFPAVMEITYVSDAIAKLQDAVVSAKGFKPYHGTAPGFYKADVAAFREALAEAEALLEEANTGNVSEAAINEIIDKLETEKGKIEEAGFVMPEPGKEYRIISAGPFFANQNVHKALTVHSDSAKTNWIWWETASPDSAQQVFTFEAIENEEGKPYYAVKHKATGKYIGQLLTTDGDGEVTVVSNSAGLNEEKDTVELRSLGLGQFGLINDGMFHTGDHHSGTVASGSTVYGCEHAVLGDKSSIVKWTADANSGSAWYIREVQKLPFEAKNISDLNFQSESISLYEGVNTLTLTADKACAFDGLTVYGTLGDVIPASVTTNGAVATVVLDTTLVETFAFSFTNSESVGTVTVGGGVSKLYVLQGAYDEAMAVNPTKGDLIGQYSDLTEYDAAIEAAKELLANGGDDEAILQAAANLDSALVHLKPNLPLADKTYFIVSGLDAFKSNHGIDVALYAKTDAPAWSYVNISNPAYLWKFEDKGELVYDAPAFYIKNVATGTYLSQYPGSLSQPLALVGAPAETQPYRIDIVSDTVVLVSDSRYTDAYIHFNGHGGGANAMGNVVHWNSGAGTASALRIVESEMYLDEYMKNFVGIEDVEIDEYVAPAKKGTYDLFGRRIDAPAATGIYIVDGKKRVIKK